MQDQTGQAIGPTSHRHFWQHARMAWTSLASTALGALIALLATITGERFKWRREQASDRRKQLHQTYSGFLAALTDAHEQMRAETLTGHPTSQARSTAIFDAFRAARCYHFRYELAIVAEQDVLDSAEDAFKVMRDIRDQLAQDGSVETEQYSDLRRTYGAGLRELQRRMRMELGADRVHLTGGS
jgi:hypothetical protein